MPRIDKINRILAEQFMPADLCKQFQLLGFNNFCLGFYTDQDVLIIDTVFQVSTEKSDFNRAILWQQAIDYLREEWKIEVLIDSFYMNSKLRYEPILKRLGSQDPLEDSNCYESHIECLEAGIRKVAPIVNNEIWRKEKEI